MTTLLYITLESVETRPDVDVIVSQVRNESKDDIPHRVLSRLRLSLSEETFGFAIEPFVGNVALAGLLQKQGHSIVPSLLLRRIIRCCQTLAQTVGIAVLIARRGEVEWPKAQKEMDMDDLLDSILADGLRIARWNHARPALRTFLAEGVEAKLWKPLTVEGGGLATHFFSNYTIHAKTRTEALAILRDAVAAQQASLLACELRESSDAPDSGETGPIVRDEGRVYFADPEQLP